MTDLASISPLVVVGARRVDRGGGGGVRQDVYEVRVHHVIVKQVKDAHPIRPICRGKQRRVCLMDDLNRVRCEMQQYAIII